MRDSFFQHYQTFSTHPLVLQPGSRVIIVKKHSAGYYCVDQGDLMSPSQRSEVLAEDDIDRHRAPS